MTLCRLSSAPLAAVLAGCALLLGACGGASDSADDAAVQGGSPQAEGAWVRLPVPGSTAAAGYLSIRNPGEVPLRFVAVSSPAFEAGEIHDMQHEDGMMRMRRMEMLEVGAGERVSLKPHGMHLMLLRPTQALEAGDSVQLLLRYEDDAGEAGELIVEAEARAP